jgi:hypothetical protein
MEDGRIVRKLRCQRLAEVNERFRKEEDVRTLLTTRNAGLGSNVQSVFNRGICNTSRRMR